EADIDLVVLEMIDERPAARLAAERPAERVHDQPLAVLRRVDLPQLLHAEAVFLRLAARFQIEALDGVARERAAHALAEHDVFAGDDHAGLVVRAGIAVLVAPELAGDDADDLASLAVYELGAAHARIDLDAKRLGLLGQPAADIAER